MSHTSRRVGGTVLGGHVRAVLALAVSSVLGAGAAGCGETGRAPVTTATQSAGAPTVAVPSAPQGGAAEVAPPPLTSNAGIGPERGEATPALTPLAPSPELGAQGRKGTRRDAGPDGSPESPAIPAPVTEVLQLENPLVMQRADAQILHHTDGMYVFAATVPEYDRIELRRADTLPGLHDAPGVVVWRKHTTGVMAAHIWAPEIHSIDGRWYLYFAAGSSTDVWAIRIYVLENTSQNPLEGSWTERGQLVTNFETFALDATTFELAGTRYVVWAQSDPSFPNNSSIFIGKMANPWTLAGPGVRLSRPEFEWETRGFLVNEGPAVLVRNGRVFITYSASATDANYCMGLLTASDSSDLLNPGSWSKSAQPVFTSSGSVFGPGHNQFTTSAEGTIDLLVYHARDYRDIVGDPLNDPNRHTRVQPFTWNVDGTPNFGAPVANGPLLIQTPRQ